MTVKGFGLPVQLMNGLRGTAYVQYLKAVNRKRNDLLNLTK